MTKQSTKAKIIVVKNNDAEYHHAVVYGKYIRLKGCPGTLEYIHSLNRALEASQ